MEHHISKSDGTSLTLRLNETELDILGVADIKPEESKEETLRSAWLILATARVSAPGV
jgi:hypothetical protein